MSEVTQNAFAIAYILLGLGLLPWILRMSNVLPNRYSAHNWKTAWIGFDMILAIMLAMTGLFVLRDSVWAIIAGSATAALLLVDVWFDVVTSQSKKDRKNGLLMAGLVEIPLAVITLFLIATYLQGHLH